MPVNQLGVYWPFKTLLQGAGISLTEDATTIRITNTGGTGGAGGGDMLQSQYAPSGIPGKVDHAILADSATTATSATTAGSVPWSGVTGVPSSFPSDWSTITSKPTVFPPSIHGLTHRGKGSDPIHIADTTDSGLLALLDGNPNHYVGGDNACHDLYTVMQTNGALPPGSIVAYGGPNLPPGFFWCNGAAVSRTTYHALFVAIGGYYGVGDGSTTFNLPNMQGRSPLCAGQGAGLTNRGLAQTGGEEGHVLSVNEMPSHAHGITINDPGHVHQLDQSILGAAQGGMGAWMETGKYKTTFAAATGLNSSNVIISAAGASWGHNNMSPFICLNYMIKV